MAPTMAKEVAELAAQSESHPPDAAFQSVLVPENEAIAKLAYALWEARGTVGGSAEEDWLAAEAELRQL